MDINQLTLSSLTFEVRYPHAYLLWDKPGQIWSSFIQQWPHGRYITAEPNRTAFRLENKTEITITLERAFIVTSHAEDKKNEFQQLCEFMLKQLNSVLKVDRFTRIGYRSVYSKQYKTIGEASEAFVSTGIARLPTGKHFGIEGKVVMPEISIGYEGDILGCRSIIKSQTTNKIVNLPLGEDFNLGDLERHEFIFDVDYYTKVETLFGQFKFEEWTKQASHVIKRDSKIFLGR
jgi:hypothetical protein